MVWAIVVNLADNVDCVAFGIGGNAQGCYRLVGLLNLHFRLANLWLLPPAEIIVMFIVSFGMTT